MIDYGDYTWSATSLLCDRIHQISNAKTCVFADSVLCLGGIKESPNEAWKDKIKWYFESNHLKDLNRIDGESMEFEWKYSQDSQHMASSNRFKNFLWTDTPLLMPHLRDWEAASRGLRVEWKGARCCGP